MNLETSISKFITSREGGNSWAQSERLVQAFREKAFWDVTPLTLEFAPILDCNANCPLCPYAKSRRNAGLRIVSTGAVPAPDDRSVTKFETAKTVLDKAKEAGIRGVLWTGGGEPTKWTSLIDAIRYSASLGLLNCLYTNGIQFGQDPKLAEEILSPENNLIFVRLSINSVSPKATRVHWGIDLNQLQPQFTGLDALFALRERLVPMFAIEGRRLPSIQISSIFDKNNIADALPICDRIAKIAGNDVNHRGSEDVMVVRPLTIHGRETYSTHDHDESVVRNIISICGRNGRGRNLINNTGLRLFLGFGLERLESGEAASYSEIIEKEFAQRDVSWSNGVFLTVGPGGIVYPSTSHNCDPHWELGNLRTQTVADIYKGERRRRVIEHANRLHWGPAFEQATARTNRLDRIARAIISRQLDDRQIEEIRNLSLGSHALLLD